MDTKVHNQIVSFIWSIADDVLRDIFVRGKYRDIILPFTVLRRLDALLVPTKDKVLEARDFLIKQNIDNKKAPNLNLMVEKKSAICSAETASVCEKSKRK